MKRKRMKAANKSQTINYWVKVFTPVTFKVYFLLLLLNNVFSMLLCFYCWQMYQVRVFL